jgi:hypothetical protein
MGKMKTLNNGSLIGNRKLNINQWKEEGWT